MFFFSLGLFNPTHVSKAPEPYARLPQLSRPSQLPFWKKGWLEKVVMLKDSLYKLNHKKPVISTLRETNIAPEKGWLEY